MAIDTAVMEQILSNMLKLQQQQSKEQAAAFARLAKAAGLDPKLIATAESKLKTLGDAAEETAKSTTTMNKAGNIAGAALADLASGLMATGGNFVNFSAKALEGTAKMSDLFAVFKDLPIIGTVASLFSALQKIQEENYESFKSLTQSGINLGQGLMQLKTDALSMGMSLQDSVKIQKEFSEAFVLMGGSASAGARNFKNFNKEFAFSNLGTELLRLGFNFQEINSLLPQYARSVGGLSKQQMADQEKLSIAVANYGKELDFISRLTGKSREEQQKAMQEQQKNAAWQAALANMTVEQREAANAALNAALAQSGKGLADMIQLTVAGLPALTDEAAALQGALPGVAEVAREFAAGINKANSATSIREKTDRALAKVQIAQLKGVEAYGKTADALAFSNDAISNVVNDARRQSIILKQAGAMTEDAALARIKSERRQQDELAKTKNQELENQIAAQKKILAFGALLSDTITPIMNQVISPLIPILTNQLPKIGIALKQFVEELVDPKKRQELFDNMMGKLVDLLSDLFVLTFAALGKKLLPDKSIQEMFSNALRIASPGIGMGLALTQMYAQPNSTAQPQGSLTDDKANRSGRSAGSFGTVGTAFENFGSGTQITAHNIEGVFTPNQITQLMQSGTSNALQGLVSQLNNTQAEMVRVLREVADYSRRNVEATNSLSGNAFA